VPLSKSMEVTRRGRYLFGRNRAYPGYFRPFFNVPWRREALPAPLPPLSPKQTSPSPHCTDITIDLLTQSEVCSTPHVIPSIPEVAMDPVTTAAIRSDSPRLQVRLPKSVVYREPVIETLAAGKLSLDVCELSPPAPCRPNPTCPDVHVPLHSAHQEPSALQPLWREEPHGVDAVRPHVGLGGLGLTHQEQTWQWPDSPMFAHEGIRLPKIVTPVKGEGWTPRGGPEPHGWVSPKVCCGRARRVHVPPLPTPPSCAQSAMQRQGTMDALLECTINEVLSF
jgi:hypothetical protein